MANKTYLPGRVIFRETLSKLSFIADPYVAIDAEARERQKPCQYNMIILVMLNLIFEGSSFIPDEVARFPLWNSYAKAG
ncbi:MULTISPECIES: hypothetical protein [unclassified Sinorhizobium]|uniref:hypothetical protein n=1 Tax=unclassified Sinorhizobium TaxID=2613772 RepID=UPI0035267C05